MRRKRRGRNRRETKGRGNMRNKGWGDDEMINERLIGRWEDGKKGKEEMRR